MALTNRLPARFTLAHGLMILAGLMTFVLVNSALADKRETQTIALATAQAEAGRTMVPRLVEIAGDTPGLDHYATLAEVQNKVLARPLPEGQPIMDVDLVPEGSLEFRTFAIPVSGYQIEGLRLTRNDRVDVVGFDEDDAPLYLASDLVVVSTSRATSEGLGATSEAYVTLQVDDAQALRLSKGQLNGPLHLVRSTGASPIIPVAVGVSHGDEIESAGGEQP